MVDGAIPDRQVVLEVPEVLVVRRRRAEAVVPAPTHRAITSHTALMAAQDRHRRLPELRPTTQVAVVAGSV